MERLTAREVLLLLSMPRPVPRPSSVSLRARALSAGRPSVTRIPLPAALPQPSPRSLHLSHPRVAPFVSPRHHPLDRARAHFDGSLQRHPWLCLCLLLSACPLMPEVPRTLLSVSPRRLKSYRTCACARPSPSAPRAFCCTVVPAVVSSAAIVRCLALLSSPAPALTLSLPRPVHAHPLRHTYSVRPSPARHACPCARHQFCQRLGVARAVSLQLVQLACSPQPRRITDPLYRIPVARATCVPRRKPYVHSCLTSVWAGLGPRGGRCSLELKAHVRKVNNLTPR